jgi:NAD+ diphosphatase
MKGVAMNRQIAVFSAGELNRSAHLRGQSDTLLRQETARIVPFWQMKPLLNAEGNLAFLPWDHAIFQTAEQPLFLGISAEGAPLFAAEVPDIAVEAAMPSGDVAPKGVFVDQDQKVPIIATEMVFCDLKAAMMGLSPLEAEVGATARAILTWHRSHAFCGSCGAQTRIEQGGWQRSCSACDRSHFPRTDPVVIMLITYGNSVLLGRSAHFPEGMYSLLAGFVEPGETLEAAVRREVLEESGVHVGDVSYIGGQPWPFPGSLMLGFAGEAQTQDIILDEDELEDALWMSREEVAQVMSGERSDMSLARKGSIASALLSNWLAGR